MSKKKFDQGNVQDIDTARHLSRKKFHPHDLVSLKPLNDRQREFLELYYSQCPLIVQSGAAGTGKTMMALYCALSEVFDPTSSYDKVIIVRSAVQSRDLGFMPGDADEKNSFFESGYSAMCNELIERYNDNNYSNLKALGYLDFVSTSFLRSVTFNRSILIMDEFQSATYHEISTVITRLGYNSRIVLCGDIRQDDLGSKSKKEQSGYHSLMKTINNMPHGSAGVVNYTIDDVVRSGIVREFLRADYFSHND